MGFSDALVLILGTKQYGGLLPMADHPRFVVLAHPTPAWHWGKLNPGPQAEPGQQLSKLPRAGPVGGLPQPIAGFCALFIRGKRPVSLRRVKDNLINFLPVP